MITRIEIEGLRGIRRGILDGLAPLTILVGPNGCGKSTVLDALMIGAHPVPGMAVGEAIRRRSGLDGGARWLVTRGVAEARIVAHGAKGPRRTRVAIEANGAIIRLSIVGDGGHEIDADVTRVHPDNTYEPAGHSRGSIGGVELSRWMETGSSCEADVRLVDSFQRFASRQVGELYNALLERGDYDGAESLLRALAPPGQVAGTLKMGAESVLYVAHENGAVPLAHAGDGVKLYVRAAMELALAKEGVLLFEEPEAHLHPRTLLALADHIRAAVVRGVQVVIATHSLELVDQLAAQWEQKDAPKEEVAAFRLVLKDGELLSTRFGREEIGEARFKFGDDVR